MQSLYFLNTKFQASSHLLWLYSPVCVGPGRKLRRPVFSQQGSNCMYSLEVLHKCRSVVKCFPNVMLRLSTLNLLPKPLKCMIYSQTCVKGPYKQDIFMAFQTGSCLLLHESSAESRSFLRYFHSAITSHVLSDFHVT